MFLTGLFLILTIALLVVSPSAGLKITFLFYLIFLYILFSGIGGFVYSLENKNAHLALEATEIIVFLLHLPLIYRLTKIDHHKHRVDKAREIFGKDIGHLDDHELKKQLAH